jgi:LysM repeat protein
LDQKNKSRARVKIAVFVVLAIHGVGLLGLLMAGCKPNNNKVDQAQNQDTGPSVETTNTPALETAGTAAAGLDTTTSATTTSNLPPNGTANLAGNLAPTTGSTTTQPQTSTATATPGPGLAPTAAGMTEYEVVAGDYPEKIAKKLGVTTKALLAANPTINPTKLQIKQKLVVPPPTALTTTTSASHTTTAPSPAATADGSQVYAVVSGDNLTKIGNKFHVTPKALRLANNLKTDQLKVGQKLKIPAKSHAPAATTSMAAATTSAAPDSVPATMVTPAGTAAQ